jgi:hypothetical protein
VANGSWQLEHGRGFRVIIGVVLFWRRFWVAARCCA